jgi:hypothetical protein
MGRPRKYNTAAEKQAAYRQRLTRETVVLHRWQVDQLQLRLDMLDKAIRAAANRGSALAVACRSASRETMLENLIRAFDQLERT